MTRDYDRLANRFRAFVDEARSHDCPLYADLSDCIRQDPEILQIASEVRRTPVPNTFFAAVHTLLLDGPDHPLGQFYGSVIDVPKDARDAFPAFREFVLDRRAEIVPILQSRITQTNEVRRCAYLVPAFQRVFGEGGGRSLSLIDVGCSAGLHLLWDRYYYDYGSIHVGDAGSPVHIDCVLRGRLQPPLTASFPPSVYRAGVDLHPIDLRDREDRRWLEALVFPDHADRRLLLKAAIAEALEHAPQIRTGDAIELLPQLVREVPLDSTLCVYHCHAMYQLSESEWNEFADMLLELSGEREIFWLLAEGYEVQLRQLRNGEIRRTPLARKDGHGRWIEWLAKEHAH